MGKASFDFQIDLFHNGGLLKHSFICMIKSISDLVSMCKIQKNSFFQTRPERLIYDKWGRHYERGLSAAQSSSTSFRIACKCFACSPTHADLTLFAKPFKFVHFCLLLGFYLFLLIKISKTLLRTNCTFMMTHAFRSDFFDVAARLRDDSQRRFLAQHSVATLLRHGFE